MGYWWNDNLKDAKEVTMYYKGLTIVEVDQPKGELPLHGFNKKAKKYYVATSAPKTLIEGMRRKGAQARVYSAIKTKVSAKARTKARTTSRRKLFPFRYFDGS